MGNDHDNNRSSALSPEALAAINSAVAAAVQGTVTAVFASLKPTLEGMALTPEKMQLLRTPPEDPEARKRFLREQRESLKSKADEAEIRRVTRARMDACPHLDKNGRSCIDLVHNFPDHQPRGICVVCGDWIHPKEWRFGPPSDAEPRGKAYLVEPHKDYRIVLQLESMN